VRQGRQQNVVGVKGTAAPVEVTGFAVQLPPLAVTVNRISAGCWTGSQENGAMYESGRPVHVPFVEEYAFTVPEHAAPVTAPHEQVVQPRPSATLP
jgi:hypothetical protein